MSKKIIRPINPRTGKEYSRQTIYRWNHHWRYDKPLLVNTLCLDCHTIQHVNNFERWQEARLLSDKLLEVAHQN